MTAKFNVSVRRQDENGIVQESKLNAVAISSGSANKTTFTFSSLADTDFLHIYIDANNTVKGETETNNYVFRAVGKSVKAYIVVDVDPKWSVVNDLIKDYIATFVDSVPLSQADVVIIVGHPLVSNSEPFSVVDDIRNFDGKAIKKAYGGIVKSGPGFVNDYSGKPEILAYGNRIEGDIAAVKRLINARNVFLDKKAYSEYYASYIDDYDTLGISVFDLMHTSEANTYFNKNNDAFKDNIKKILFDNNFEVAVKPVMTRETTSYGANTTLRVKNVNSEFSSDYKDAVGISDKPVVLSRGLWSNLLSWEDFGKELASDPENARDVWLIEITGGPLQDCPTCPNYNYADLKDYYWPALIAGVQEYSGKNTLDYVGFSNGCRVGLSSLESYSLSGKNNTGYYFDYSTGNYLYSDLAANPVNTFIGVGCPGAFEGESAFSNKFGQYGQDILGFFAAHGITHITSRDVGLRLQSECSESPIGKLDIRCDRVADSLQEDLDDNRISRNLGADYLNFVTDTNDAQPGTGLQLQNFSIIYGQHPRVYLVNVEPNSDGVVTREDAEGIQAAVNATTEHIDRIDNVNHRDLVSDDTTENLIGGRLND